MPHSRAHPFFSRIGCLLVLLLVMALAVVLYLRGGLPFSPGPLNAQRGDQALEGFASHAAFESQCERCHAPWRGVTAERCETCHTTVARQRSTEMGLHGRLADSSRCELCHVEHQGREGNLTQVSADVFPHDVATGFSLVHHQTDYDGTSLLCAECHGEAGFEPAEVECISCHSQAAPAFMSEHRALFGDACLACHDGVDTIFSEHAFPLDHGDEGVQECQSCHQESYSEYTCYNCHEHNVAEVREEHIDEEIFEFDDCAGCHPTGREDEAERFVDD